MNHQPSMLLIGATGRNAGKTMLACSLIRRYAAAFSVFGVKITAVNHPDRGCPRGRTMCGVCGAIAETSDFCLTEEIISGDDKDTKRMRASGAAAVYWLRVRRDRLETGIAALTALLPKDACIVCESNSARRVLTPGLFVIMRRFGDAGIKESCQAVMPLADKIIEFDGTALSLAAETIVFSGGRWRLFSDTPHALP